MKKKASKQYLEAKVAFDEQFAELLEACKEEFEPDRKAWRLCGNSWHKTMRKQRIDLTARDGSSKTCYIQMPGLSDLDLLRFKLYVQKEMLRLGFSEPEKSTSLPSGTYEKMLEGDAEALTLFEEHVSYRALRKKGGKHVLDIMGTEGFAREVFATAWRYARNDLSLMPQRVWDVADKIIRAQAGAKQAVSLPDSLWKVVPAFSKALSQNEAAFEELQRLQANLGVKTKRLKRFAIKVGNPSLTDEEVAIVLKSAGQEREGLSTDGTRSRTNRSLQRAYKAVREVLEMPGAQESYPNLVAIMRAAKENDKARE